MNARRTGTVSAAALSGLVVTLGLAQVIAPEWVKGVGLDVWNYHTLRDQLEVGEQEAAVAQAKLDQAIRQSELGSHVASRLIDGVLTLAEATDELEPTLRNAPGFETTRVAHYNAPTFRHGVARYVIVRARDLLSDDPTRWAAVSARLEAEYAALE